MQTKICSYIEKNKIEGKLKVNKNIIEEEVNLFNSKDSAKYFKLNYLEVRTDQEFLQFTPGEYNKNGYLKIAKDGTISLLDNQFNPYVSSTNFYWKDETETLCSETEWKIADKQSRSTTCARLTFFAAAATVTAVSAYLLSTGTVEIKFKP